jgi:hypothetical protein
MARQCAHCGDAIVIVFSEAELDDPAVVAAHPLSNMPVAAAAAMMTFLDRSMGAFRTFVEELG